MSRDPTVSINGKNLDDLRYEKGYLILDREWQTRDVIVLDLGMDAELIASNPRVDATRGCLAIQRGPIVYCLEDKDQSIHDRLLDVEIDTSKPLITRWNNDLLDGVMVIEADGQFNDAAAWQSQLYLPVSAPIHIESRRVRLVAIPYFAWGNRTIGGMRVWIPKKSI